MKEIQKGLYLKAVRHTANGKNYDHAILTSADGYCFYYTKDEYFDEEGNLITDVKPIQRAYMTKNIVPLESIEELNKQFISVPIQNGFDVEYSKAKLPIEDGFEIV